MKSLITILFAMLIALQAYTQNSLSGKITDKETKETLPGATIYFPDLRKGASTNINGIFEIKGLPAGTFLSNIRFLGYSTKVVKIKIDGETKLDIELVPAVAEMGEIIVTGVSASTERKLSPIPTIVINKLSFNEGASNNIIDAIAKQPGISQITTGAAISKPVIRGLGYNRVVVLNDNIRQEGQQWGDEHGIEIDEYSIGRVEIIKGPGSLMYGSDAMAGVINFLSPEPVEEGKIIGNIMSNYQTNNNLLGFSAMNAGNINGINWLARISSKKAGNYSNSYDGKVYNSGFKELNLNGSIGINKKWGYSQLHFSNFNQTLGLIEGERDSLGNFVRFAAINDTTIEEQSLGKNDLKGYKYSTDIPRQDVNHFKIASNSKFFFKKSDLALSIALQQNRRKEFDNPLNEQESTLFFLLNTINYNIKYALPDIKGWETSFGINGMQQTNRNKGKEFLIPEYDLFDAGIFYFIQKSFSKLHISGGLRFDQRRINSKQLYLNANNEPTPILKNTTTVKFEKFNLIFSDYSASAGGSYNITDKLISKLNISRGFRSPNIAELGSNGIHEGTFRYENGNTGLESETSIQIDAGLLYNSDHISFELTVFQNSIQNYIFLEKLTSASGGDSIASTSDYGADFSAYKYVQENAKLYGGEISMDIHPHPLDWLHFENSFSIVRGVLKNQPDSTKYLPFIPAPKLHSELRANFKKASSNLHNLYINIGIDYVFEQNQFFKAFNTETATPAYMLLNAGMGADITNSKGNTMFSVFLVASNLLDVGYQSHLSRLKYAPENPANGKTGVFNMGRNFSVRLAVPLEWKTHSNDQ